MIIEGLMTTLNADGSVNLAPMGPSIADESVGQADWERLRLRPFKTSTTYQNLLRAGEGVFHVSDDVELLAAAAIGQAETPRFATIADFRTPRLADACRWYALRVESVNDRSERVEVETHVVAWGRLGDFAGFNRAKHAVVEAAILATRIGLLPAVEILAQLESLRPWVEKTGGAAERRAFSLLEDHIRRS
jgi:hypothetical protein